MWARVGQPAERPTRQSHTSACTVRAFVYVWMRVDACVFVSMDACVDA